MSDIKDISLAPDGERKIKWVTDKMPVLCGIKSEFEKEKPFSGIKIAVSIHLEAKTAYLCRVLEAGGAKVYVTGSNPLSTQDDIAAALASGGMEVYAWHSTTSEEYKSHITKVLSFSPDLVLDDGGDLSEELHTVEKEKAAKIIGLCEETTTGVMRLKSRSRLSSLAFPAINVNDADCKHLFDNRYGTGQSVLDGIMRTTNVVIAGKNVVVAGYGWCGKGIALRAKGMGAKVIVTEVDPVKAMEAAMDGNTVMTMDEAAVIGDIFVTVTGCKDIITNRHFVKMKDGAILSNAGHFDVEVSVAQLKAMSSGSYIARNNITAYKIGDKELYLLAEGRLVNLAAADGHPAEIMDLSFSIQALSLKYLLHNKSMLEKRVYEVPEEIDNYVAELKLKAMNINIDSLSDEQRRYMFGARE